MISKVKITAVMVFALAFTCSSALAQQANTVSCGVTSVTLSSELVAALKTLGVTAGTVSPTNITNGVATFPAVTGAIDLKTEKGEIAHSGGLTFSAGKTEVAIQSFTIDTTGTKPLLTGIAVRNGTLLGRVPLFDLNLAGSSVSPGDDGVLKISGVQLTLDPAAAADLNSFFSVSAFKGGLSIGTAEVVTILSAEPGAAGTQ